MREAVSDIVLTPSINPVKGRKESTVKCLIDHHVVLSRAPEGPLAAQVGPFARSLREQGYTRGAIHQQVRLAAGFSRWLNQQGIAVRRLTSEHPPRYLRARARQVRPGRGDAAALRHLLEFLRGAGVIPAEKPSARPLPPAERWTTAYAQHLRDVRGLARATIVNYVPFIRRFLQDRFSGGPVTLSRLSARDVVGFVQRQVPQLHPKRAKLLTTALRSFLRYARYRGAATRDLAAAVPVVANWSMSSIPRAIAADQVRQVLASIDRRIAMGRRDYAILLLLARLGVRSGEVVQLELGDIDWTAGHLRVRGKRGQRSELPLPVDVGKAIAAYLQRGRPASPSRRVFLRAKAPIRGFSGPGGVGSVVRHALQRAGMQAPTTGAHQFRHGLATEMLRHGASLSEIGAVLGHRSPQTTTLYTTVDLTALRTLAVPWPGGGR
jgi:site-specific recombinase XerD